MTLDGTTVYNPTHAFGFFSTFNPDAIKDVKLHKGAYPAEYGGRLGSVVSIYNKDGNRQQTKAGLTLGLIASRAYVEGPYGGSGDEAAGSHMVAVRRSTIEPILAASRSDAVPDDFSFYDASAKINYDFLRSESAQDGASLGELPNVLESVEGGTGVFGSYVRAFISVNATCVPKFELDGSCPGQSHLISGGEHLQKVVRIPACVLAF